jgi:hypothetical protein
MATYNGTTGNDNYTNPAGQSDVMNDFEREEL